MKKAKLLLSTLAAMLIVFAVSAQPIYFQISDVMYANGDTELQFNVQTHTTVPATYFRDFQLFFDYDGGAFGTNIFANGNVYVTPVGIMLNPDPFLILGDLYNLVNPGADNGPTTFAVLTATAYPGSAGGAALTIPAFGTFPYNNEVPLAWVDWLQINITIADDVAFMPNVMLRHDKMDGGQYYTGTADATPIKYDDPGFYENDVITAWPGDCAYTWDGGGDGTSWEDAMNWNPDGIPDFDCETTIPDGSGAKGLITIGGAAATAALTVGSGVDLEILGGASLTTWGLFTNNGNFYVRDGGAYLDWAGFAGTGMVTVERFLPMMPSGTNAGWHLVGAPTNNEVTGNWASYWVKAWLETGNTYVDVDPCGGDATAGNCCPPSAFNVPLIPGIGFAVKKFDNYACGITIPGCAAAPTQDQMIEFTGTMANLNTGGGSIPFTASNFGVPGPQYDNWNLFANPYPASIDVEAIVFDLPNMAPTVNYYDEMSQSYVWYTQGAGGPGSQFIPPTQGVFCLATGAGNFTLTGAERTVAGAAMFYNDQAKTLKLEASNVAIGTVDHAWITFNEEASNGFDLTLDAKKMLAKNEMTPQIYTVSENAQYAANVMPAANVVPLNFEAMVAGTYTITAAETDFDHVYIVDAKTGVIQDLNANPVYTFTAEAEEDAARFTIHFTDISGALEANGAVVYGYGSEIHVNVMNPNAEVAIYNLVGQEVYRTNVNETFNVITMNDVNTYYVVKVYTENNVVTEKVYVQ
jgi:hypothetical protein